MRAFTHTQTPDNSVVFVMVPPTRFEMAMLMDLVRPFRDKLMLSRISGASDAMGAKKKASSTDETLLLRAPPPRAKRTFSSDAVWTTASMKGSEKNKIVKPPHARKRMPFHLGFFASPSSSESPASSERGERGGGGGGWGNDLRLAAFCQAQRLLLSACSALSLGCTRGRRCTGRRRRRQRWSRSRRESSKWWSAGTPQGRRTGSAPEMLT
jgi:hypothetical protein